MLRFLPSSVLLLFPVLPQLINAATYFTPPLATEGLPSSSLTSAEQWYNLLGNVLWFYDAQRSGVLTDDDGAEKIAWRNDSALQDGQDVGVDLVGGYYDAGDYLKCTYPLTFVLASVAWGAIDFGTGYDQASQTDELDGMLRWGLDWLAKAHPESSTLFVQVGDASVDNNYWGGDLDIPDPRPSYQINATAPGTDAAAGAAAAFAAASFLYSSNATLNTSSSAYSPPSNIANSTYSASLLQHARELYAFANSTEMMTYQTSVPAVGDVYGSSGYQDQLIYAGLWLALATDGPSYYADAVHYYSSYQIDPVDTVFNWDSVVPGLPILLTQIGLARPALATNAGLDPNVTYWQEQSESVLDAIVNGQGRAKKTDGGLLWYDGDSQSASLNPALNAAMLLTRYASMASTSAKSTSYLSYAQTQVDYALGKNPMSAPYVVGVNPNAPTNPHSAMASGGNNISFINTDPEEELYVLYGAVVGGPDHSDKFWDLRDDYIQSEVALDYTAPLLTLSAANILLNPSTPPYYVNLATGSYQAPDGHPCDAAYPCGGGGLSAGAIIAIVVVIVVVVLALVLFIGWKKFGWFTYSRLSMG